MSAVQQHPFQRLLEIGPGPGAITKYFVDIPNISFKAVEIDKEKIDYLLNHYPVLQGKLIEADFLDMPIPFDEPFSIVGNFPYNISSQILFRIIDWKSMVENVIGMFQKEVAQRVAAPSGNKTYGVLSVLVQAFFSVEYLFEVHQNSFSPPPKVKSAVIRLKPRQPPAMHKERSFFILVKTAFNQRRKTLRNAVKGLFDEEVLKDEIFNKRAEQLSVEDFASLTFRMSGVSVEKD